MHLLKWKFQPTHRSRSWDATISVQRYELLRSLKQMLSLRPHLRDELSEMYPIAVKEAIAETSLPDEAFPSTCPFSLEQILDAEFFPD
jgi:hypothetical protein